MARLAQNLAVDQDHSIGAQHQAIVKVSGDGFGLGTRKTRNVTKSVLGCEPGLINVRGDCFELPADGPKYFRASRTLRSQHQFLYLHSKTLCTPELIGMFHDG